MAGQISSLRTGVKYKDTPIGKIPVDWEFASLGKIAYLQGGFAFKSKNYKEKGLPLVRISNVTSNEVTLNECVYLPRSFAEQHSSFLLESGDVLVAMSGATTGKIGLVSNKDLPALFNQRVGRFVIKDSNRITKSYLAQVVLTKRFKEELLTDAAGGAQPNVSGRNIERIMIPLPPLTEQKKIADILTSVDDAIEKTTQTIEKTKVLKKGLMQRLLSRGIGHRKFKKTEIGEIPMEWEVEKLGGLCIGKPEYGANTAAIDKKDNLPRYIRITDITEDGKLLDSTWQSIKRESAEAYILNEGDLLFARSGATVGKTYLYNEEDGECAFAGYLIRFKTDPRLLLPEFLFYFTHSSYYYNCVRGMFRAGAQPNINAKEYSNMFLPKPPIKEQKQITEILSAVHGEIEKESNHKEQLELLKKSLMQVLLTGKLRATV